MISRPALRDLRDARGWSQARLLLAMELAAPQVGLTLASRASLKTTLSRWENGHISPEAPHRRLLAIIFGVDEGDLGFATEPAHAPAARLGLALPRQVNKEVLTYFNDVFAQYVHADTLLGPGQLLGVVVEQWKQLDRLCRHASGPDRAELMRLLAQYGEFLGWLHQDSGDTANAAVWTTRAGEIAQVLGDPFLTSYSLVRRSGVAADAGKAQDTISYAAAALRPEFSAPPRLRALAYRQLAQGHAMVGDEKACHEAIAHALDHVEQVSSDDYASTSYGTTAYVQMEAGASLARLGHSEAAEAMLSEAIAGWPTGQQRDKSLCVARLADVQAAAGEVAAACETAMVAADLVAVAPSARSQRTLRLVRNRVHRHRRVPQVAELLQRLTDVA